MARSESRDERNGVSHLFVFFAPLEKWRHVKVTDRRAAIDWAQWMNEVVELPFPDAERSVLEQDKLTTHLPAALSSAFPPEEAKRIWDKLELQSTPKHGSGLTMAEIELSVRSRQCLDRRLIDQDVLRRETAAWEDHRTTAKATLEWRFTTADACVKLKKLYPILKLSE